MIFENEVKLTGRATRDAMKCGNGPYKFSVATGGNKKSNSEGRYPVEYFEIACWRDFGAEVKKGEMLRIVGRLKQYVSEHDGKKEYRVQIVTNDITRPEIQAPTPPVAQEPIPRERKIAALRPINPTDPITDDDIPF